MKLTRDNRTEKYKKQISCSEKFGIEKEALRVDENGNLAGTLHPLAPMEKITRDFAESQMEFISSPAASIDAACNEICCLEQKASRILRDRITGSEYLWNYSNPPHFDGEKEIAIAQFYGEQQKKTRYRDYLAKKYGKAKMLYSGIHFNYSFSGEFLKWAAAKSGNEPDRHFSDRLYLKLADGLMDYSWLMVFLTAASPVSDVSFQKSLGLQDKEAEEIASMRNSRFGYWNGFTPRLSYRSLKQYCKSLAAYVEQGKICAIQELYYPIRLKPAGENSLSNLMENGVSHLELRMVDINPFCFGGVERMDLKFLHLLMVYLLAEELLTKEGVTEAEDKDELRLRLHKEAAGLWFLEKYPEYTAKALLLLSRMHQFFRTGDVAGINKSVAGYDVDQILFFQRDKIKNPKKRYAVMAKREFAVNYIGKMTAAVRKRGLSLDCCKRDGGKGWYDKSRII